MKKVSQTTAPGVMNGQRKTSKCRLLVGWVCKKFHLIPRSSLTAVPSNYGFHSVEKLLFTTFLFFNVRLSNADSWLFQGHLPDLRWLVCGWRWRCCKKVQHLLKIFSHHLHQIRVPSLTRQLQNLDFISSPPVPARLLQVPAIRSSKHPQCVTVYRRGV